MAEFTKDVEVISVEIGTGDDLSKGDETAIDAEITNEVKDATPKRKRNAAA